jgi:hypothetical protein
MVGELEGGFEMVYALSKCTITVLKRKQQPVEWLKQLLRL